jgi:hypothetical protein
LFKIALRFAAGFDIGQGTAKGLSALECPVGRPPGDAAEDANSAQTALLNYLSDQGLNNVRVTLDERAPTPDAASGKLRQVVASAESRSRAGTSALSH